MHYTQIPLATLNSTEPHSNAQNGLEGHLSCSEPNQFQDVLHLDI